MNPTNFPPNGFLLTSNEIIFLENGPFHYHVGFKTWHVAVCYLKAGLLLRFHLLKKKNGPKSPDDFHSISEMKLITTAFCLDCQVPHLSSLTSGGVPQMITSSSPLEREKPINLLKVLLFLGFYISYINYSVISTSSIHWIGTHLRLNN